MKNIFVSAHKLICMSIGLAATLLVLCAETAHAIPILETAPLGSSNGGTSILPSQFLGARFHLDSAYVVTGVGGHVKSDVLADRSIFVAIVPTSGPDNVPLDLSLGNALFVQTFLAPYNDVGPFPFQVAEIILPTNLLLGPGDYGVIFGSGLFGATGTAWMPVSGGLQPLPWFFSLNLNLDSAFHSRSEQPVRFVVEGSRAEVPEPSTLALALIGLFLIVGRRHKGGVH